MVQIISGFTEAALHRLPPLLCNPGSPWRTPGSHGSRGKHVCKYSFALHSLAHACTRYRAEKNLQTECSYVHMARSLTHTYTHNGRI